MVTTHPSDAIIRLATRDLKIENISGPVIGGALELNVSTMPGEQAKAVKNSSSQDLTPG